MMQSLFMKTRSDSADAQGNLSLRWALMFEDLYVFSHVGSFSVIVKKLSL